MVQGEREVALAAAEVDDPQFAGRRQVVDHVVDEFEKPVDLPELGVLRRANLARGVITPISTRNGQGTFSGIRYVLDRLCSRGVAVFVGRLCRAVNCAVRTDANFEVGLGREDVHPLEGRFEQFANPLARFFRRQVFVRFAVVATQGPLIGQRFLDERRAEGDFVGRADEPRRCLLNVAPRHVPSASDWSSRAQKAAASVGDGAVWRCHAHGQTASSTWAAQAVHAFVEAAAVDDRLESQREAVGPRNDPAPQRPAHLMDRPSR